MSNLDDDREVQSARMGRYVRMDRTGQYDRSHVIALCTVLGLDANRTVRVTAQHDRIIVWEMDPITYDETRTTHHIASTG